MRPSRTPFFAGLGVALALSGCGTMEPREVRSGPGFTAPRQQVAPVPYRAPRSAPRTITPEHWAAEAERWLGTPYRFGGNDRSGIDCSGLACQMYLRMTGLRLPRVTVNQFRVGRAVARRELQAGDLVFFDTRGAGVSHVGVVLDADRFVHASVSRGVTYSRLSEEYWSRQFLGGRRIP